MFDSTRYASVILRNTCTYGVDLGTPGLQAKSGLPCFFPSLLSTASKLYNTW